MPTGPVVSTTTVACCGAPVQAITLTGDTGSRRQVELLRCPACGAGRWRLDGAEVDKGTALGALNEVFATPAPTRRVPRRSPAAVQVAPPSALAVPAVEPAAAPDRVPAHRPADLPAALSELLAGWTVLGRS